MPYIDTIPEIAALCDGADHVDVKQTVSTKSLREFIAAALSYMPGWMVALYKVRAVFVRLLGLKQDGYPGKNKVAPQDVIFTPGDMGTFFKVKGGQEDQYWIAGATEKHLSGYLAIAADPLPDGTKRFHLATIVYYHHWTGRIYFNIIRPLHHVVVWAMLRHAAR
ncbi:MAG: DUF2867 domain-containing protein [Desulfovibrio sp.]|uniref:DUF2867 domain-containing protein n=1 Tax=Desulfovibrio sp. 7SRBS1 TaxID=3378064 RepID=UPI003B3E576A